MLGFSILTLKRSGGPARRGLCFLVLVAAIVLCGRIVSAQSPAAPGTVSDMAVVPDKEGGVTVYVADARAGAIYFSKLEREGRSTLELSKFSQFFRCADYPRPAALAYHGGKLFAYDLETSALFSIDPAAHDPATPGCQAEKVADGNRVKELLQGGSLSEPVSLALKTAQRDRSENGAPAALEIVIGGGAGQIIKLESPGGAAGIMPAIEGLGSPVRASFAADSLMILNQMGTLYTLRQPDPARPESDSGASPVNLPAALGVAGSRLRDVVLYRGVYYGIDQKQLVIFLPTGQSVDTLAAGPMSPLRVAVTADRLLVADGLSNAVHSFPRPVPVTVSLENDLNGSTKAQVALYRYLYDNGLLRYRAVIAKKRYAKLEALLVDENVPLPGFRTRWGNDIGEFPNVAEMIRLICDINKWDDCRQARSPVVKVEEGQSVLLPDVPVEAVLKTSMVSLDKKVEDYVKERVLLPEHQSRASEEYVADKNDYELKSGGTRLFNMSKGDFYLPATIWHLSVLVNSTDLRDNSSKFQQEVTSLPKVYAFTKETLNTRANAASDGSSAPQDGGVTQPPCPGTREEQLECLRRERLRLKKAIRYPELPPVGESNEIADVVVGVLEKEGSTPPHPDFTNDEGQSAWFEAAPPECRDTMRDCRFERAAAPPPAGEPQDASTQPSSLLVPEPRADREHGIFVAGLIAARQRKGVDLSGLLPNVGLFLINIDNTVTPARLSQVLDFATENKVRIFNISSKFSDPDHCDEFDEQLQENRCSTLRDLLKKMKDMKGVLWVVAAGDQNKDIRDDAGDENVPVKWSFADVKNIIGVGASDYDMNYAKVWPPGDSAAPKMAISNFSKKHIHLIAPGVEVFSTASGGRYAKWYGSSFAAPQVTAAAAALFAQKIRHPNQLKARLIYTSWWDDRYLGESRPGEEPTGDLWGGMLDYERAVWQPDRNLVDIKNNSERFAITFEGNPDVTVLDGRSYDLGLEGGEFPLDADEQLTIRFKQILRIQRYASSPDGAERVRLIYLDRGQLKVINKAVLKDTSIPCDVVEAYDKDEKKFVRSDAFRTAEGKQAIALKDIKNYVAATPDSAALGRPGRSPWN